jgi:hypothetical protein
MAILSKGYTFTSTEQVTSTKLGNLVDNSTFASGAVDGVTTELSGGSIIVKNGGITPTKLSTGAPSWDGSSNLTVSGNGTFTGTLSSTGALSTSNNLSVSGTASITGTSTFTGNSTFAGQIIRSGTASNRTVELKTGSASPNAISFGWDSGDLLVTVDGSEYKVTLTPA